MFSCSVNQNTVFRLTYTIEYVCLILRIFMYINTKRRQNLSQQENTKRHREPWIEILDSKMLKGGHIESHSPTSEYVSNKYMKTSDLFHLQML